MQDWKAGSGGQYRNRGQQGKAPTAQQDGQSKEVEWPEPTGWGPLEQAGTTGFPGEPETEETEPAAAGPFEVKGQREVLALPFHSLPFSLLVLPSPWENPGWSICTRTWEMQAEWDQLSCHREQGKARARSNVKANGRTDTWGRFNAKGCTKC